MEKTMTDIFKPHYLMVEQICKSAHEINDIEMVKREFYLDDAKQASEAFMERLLRYKYGETPQRLDSMVAVMTANHINELGNLRVAHDDEFMIHLYHVTKPSLTHYRNKVVCLWYSKRDSSIVYLFNQIQST
jgi:hypothetical protein